MARRRQGDSEENGEKVAISLKLPKKLLDRIDSYWKENSASFTGRTHFIEEACSFYLTCEKCPECGRLNTPQSKTCSYCGSKLEGEEYLTLKNSVIRELSNYDKLMSSILSLKEEYIDLDNKIKWYVNKLDDKRKVVIDALTPEFYAAINHSMNRVDCLLKYQEYYKKFYEAKEKLPSPADLEEIVPNIPDNFTYLDFSSNSPVFVEGFYRGRCIGINFAYYNSKLILDNLETSSTQDLRISHLSLVTEGLHLSAFLDDMMNALNILRNIEKIIDVIPDGSTSTISISRREQQD